MPAWTPRSASLGRREANSEREVRMSGLVPSCRVICQYQPDSGSSNCGSPRCPVSPAFVSRSEIVDHLYDQDFDRDSNTIEVFVGRLRRKLGVDIIQTMRGLGYLVTADGEVQQEKRASETRADG